MDIKIEEFAGSEITLRFNDRIVYCMTSDDLSDLYLAIRKYYGDAP